MLRKEKYPNEHNLNNLNNLRALGSTFEVPPGAFSYCGDLELTHLPDNVTDIGAKAFYMCDALALTHLPEGLITIGAYAFYMCKALKLETLPSTLQNRNVHHDAFEYSNRQGGSLVYAQWLAKQPTVLVDTDSDSD